MKRCLLTIFYLLVLQGCSPRITPNIELEAIPSAWQEQENQDLGTDAFVFVSEVADVRSSEVIVQGGKKESRTKSDVGLLVQEAIGQALQDNGFTLAEDAPVVVKGEVRDWIARVDSGVSVKVDCQAALFIEVLGPANNRIYAGTYKGSATAQQASVSSSDVRKFLSISMAEAVKQIVLDEQLLDLLSSF